MGTEDVRRCYFYITVGMDMIGCGNWYSFIKKSFTTSSHERTHQQKSPGTLQPSKSRWRGQMRLWIITSNNTFKNLAERWKINSNNKSIRNENSPRQQSRTKDIQGSQRNNKNNGNKHEKWMQSYLNIKPGAFFKI